LEAPDLSQEIAAMTAAAQAAARRIGSAAAEQRNSALRAIADQVRSSADSIIEANAIDLKAAEERGLSAAMVDRLRLDRARLDKIAAAIDEVASLPEVVGRLEEESTRPNGLAIARMRIPLGVVLMIYESRPNVTTDAAALCIKSGNAVILRGGSEAFHSNQALGRAVAAGLEAAGLPAACAQVMSTKDRAGIKELLQHDEEIDIVIPRGGEGLIRFVAENSRIPVLKHYKGVCHLYVHAAADLDMALDIADNAKTQRPGVCNAVETILVDAAVADSFVPRLSERLRSRGVELRGDQKVVDLASGAASLAGDDDWAAEYLDLIVAIRVVDSLEAAMDHIATYGSNHTESIITNDSEAAERFLREVSSSTVMVNASTRFADGGELGLGAEIGISTTKMHAYGPMGVEGLTTRKFVVRGTGQVRN
jgi:glutamate-5-semialdehyde dehydrogenase